MALIQINRRYTMKKWIVYGVLGSVGVLACVGAVNAGNTIYQAFQPHQKVHSAPVVAKATMDFPESIKMNATLFTLSWFTTYPNESLEDQTNRLAPYITATLKDKLNQSPDLLLKAGVAGKQTLSVRRADVSDKKWIQPGKKAIVTLRTNLDDGRLIYVDVPVEKSGNTYLVSGLPALVPPPVADNSVSPDSNLDLGDDQPAIQSMLNNFFDGWLQGNQELTSRYTIGKIPSSNLLDQMAATYKGVQVEARSENPVQVSAQVQLVDGNGNVFTMEYLVTVEKSNGVWKVKNLEM